MVPEAPEPGDNSTPVNEVTPAATQQLAQTGSSDLSWIGIASALLALVGGGLITTRLARRKVEA